jgi:hypothetical protein
MATNDESLGGHADGVHFRAQGILHFHVVLFSRRGGGYRASAPAVALPPSAHPTVTLHPTSPPRIADSAPAFACWMFSADKAACGASR